MRSNCIKELNLFYHIAIFVFVDFIRAAPTNGNLNKSCQPGFYRSDFLSGGCTSCRGVRGCENEEFEDKQRCLAACVSTRSTAITVITLSSRTRQETRPTTTRITTRITTKKSVQKVPSSDPRSGIIIELQIPSQPSMKRIRIKPKKNEMTSEKSKHHVIVGVLCTVGGLAVLLCIGLLWYRNVKSTLSHTGFLKSHHVAESCTSNSDNNIEACQRTHENHAGLREKTWNLGILESRSELNDLPETDL